MVWHQGDERMKLDGKKTHLVAGVMIGLSLLKMWGWLTTEAYLEIMGVLVGLGFGFLRAGVSKCN